MDNIKNRLSYQLFFFTLLSLALGVGVYILAHTIGQFVINTYLTTESTRTQRLEQSARSLQDYVYAHELNQSDKDMLDSWVDGERYLMLQVYGDGMIMYDSTMDVDMSVLEMAGGDSIQWQKTYSIAFADGIGDAMFYEYFSMRDELVNTVASTILGVITFAIVLILLIRRKTKYITQLSTELHILEGGNLEHSITVRGSDELGTLAKSIDDMRVAMIKRQEDEELLQKKSYELITAMSHDLRSPLTSLIGYLDIVNLKKYRGEEERDEYLIKSRTKAYRIKEISDDLFEYSLSSDTEKDTPKLEKHDCADFLDKVLNEIIFELESADFTVDYRHLPDTCHGFVQLDQSLIERAFDNLISNIKKYADPHKPVSISCIQTKQGIIEVKVENAVSDSKADEGTGIGLAAVKRIAEAHDWVLTIQPQENRFAVTISLPVEQSYE